VKKNRSIPFGYTMENGKIIINKAEADTVQLIFNEYANGLSLSKIADLMEKQNIVYAVPPASFEQIGQRVRLCDAVMQQKMGTCLDLTLFYASCLEAMGLHPLLILKTGHIFIGVWLEELTFPETVQDEPHDHSSVTV